MTAVGGNRQSRRSACPADLISTFSISISDKIRLPCIEAMNILQLTVEG